MKYPLSKKCWNIGVFFVICVCACASTSAQVYTVIGAKPKGSARDSSLAEAGLLSYRYDKQQDLLTFRITLYATPNKQAFDVNLAFDTRGDDATKMNWWGALDCEQVTGNKSDEFNNGQLSGITSLLQFAVFNLQFPSRFPTLQLVGLL